MDIAQAFDSLLHGLLDQALRARRVHPTLARALLQEYQDLRARVSVGDSGPSDWFPYTKGGRQGGAETPEVFNLVVEFLLEPVIEEWRQRGLGFTMGEHEPITHAVWADNFYVFSKDPQEAAIMFEDITQAFYEAGFSWKPDSLQVLLSHSFHEQASMCIDTLLYGKSDIPVVDKMLVLGTMLVREGSTATSMEYRFSQAARCYWSHSKTLEAR